MLGKAEKILARQDVDRSLLLFFMNTFRKAIIRDKEIFKFQKFLTNVAVVDGAVDLTALKVKAVKLVEHDKGSEKIPLIKLENYATAREYYPDFYRDGKPAHYYEQGLNLYILPIVGGTFNILAEVWPDELTDTVTSTDITTTEIPEVWIYVAAAEYFDYFDETDKGNYWRQKGTVLLEQYINQLNRQEAYGINNFVKPYTTYDYDYNKGGVY